jgi:hypothetical protein
MPNRHQVEDQRLSQMVVDSLREVFSQGQVDLSISHVTPRPLINKTRIVHFIPIDFVPRAIYIITVLYK